MHVEGDPDHPINQGALCPKGATIKHNIVNDRRMTRPMYRAPGSDKWEEKSWDFMIDRIARLLKDTRDAKLREANALTAVGVPCGPINTVAQGVAFADEIGLDPVVLAGAGAAAVPTIRHPLEFSASPPRYDLPPPGLDEHGTEIREWLAS